MENNIIRIYENGENDPTVDARELHRALGNGDRFAGWVADRIEQCDLIENQDYVVIRNLPKNPSGGRPTKEYALTLDAAKHLAMMERNDKGKEIRQYFIDFEKKARKTLPASIIAKARGSASYRFHYANHITR